MSQFGDRDGLIGTFSAGAGKAGIRTGDLAWLWQFGYIQDYIYVNTSNYNNLLGLGKIWNIQAMCVL